MLAGVVDRVIFCRRGNSPKGLWRVPLATKIVAGAAHRGLRRVFGVGCLFGRPSFLLTEHSGFAAECVGWRCPGVSLNWACRPLSPYKHMVFLGWPQRCVPCTWPWLHAGSVVCVRVYVVCVRCVTGSVAAGASAYKLREGHGSGFRDLE